MNPRSTSTANLQPLPEVQAPVDVPERLQQQARIAAATSGEVTPLPTGRLSDLAERFGLDALELDTVALLWVCAFEPELRAELTAREPGAHVTLRAIARLFGHPARIRLASESQLLLWQFVREHALIDGSAALSIDPALIVWLEGEHELARGLAGRVRILSPGFESSDWPLAALASLLQSDPEQRVLRRVHLLTDDEAEARSFAAALVHRLGALAFEVPRGALDAELEAPLLVQRQAYLDDCVPLIALADAGLTHPRGTPPYPLQIVHGAGELRPVAAITDTACSLQPLSAPERQRLWTHLLPAAKAWPEAELRKLALNHDASVQELTDVAAGAPADAAQASIALRTRMRGATTPFARRAEASFEWRDLVLPKATLERLEEIAFEGRERQSVWSEAEAARLFPYGRGLVALFAGPPGTGKTMAAQVIAKDLGLDLLVVDLAAIVSKWVGETAQHLQQLLSSRAAQRAVLLFDEADALYAKRVEEVRDAQDRFANFDTSHLMTAIENYPGIVLLASNLKANIDTAFLRRIRHVVDFQKPSQPLRLQIWQNVVTGLFGATTVGQLQSALHDLSQIEATGALIKGAALSTLFTSRRTATLASREMFAQMLSRELAKEGAGLSERELQSTLGGAP